MSSTIAYNKLLPHDRLTKQNNSKLRNRTYLMFSSDMKLQLVLLNKLAGTVLTLSGLFSGVLEAEREATR